MGNWFCTPIILKSPLKYGNLKKYSYYNLCRVCLDCNIDIFLIRKWAFNRLLKDFLYTIIINNSSFFHIKLPFCTKISNFKVYPYPHSELYKRSMTFLFLSFLTPEKQKQNINNILVNEVDNIYYDVGFIRVFIIQVWLAANHCLPVDNDYRIGIVEVGSNKLC